MCDREKVKEKVKACPFCGGRAKICVDHDLGRNCHFVLCWDCKTEGPGAVTEEKAIKLWNHRTPAEDEGEAKYRGECHAPDCKERKIGYSKYCPKHFAPTAQADEGEKCHKGISIGALSKMNASEWIRALQEQVASLKEQLAEYRKNMTGMIPVPTEEYESSAEKEKELEEWKTAAREEAHAADEARRQLAEKDKVMKHLDDTMDKWAVEMTEKDKEITYLKNCKKTAYDFNTELGNKIEELEEERQEEHDEFRRIVEDDRAKDEVHCGCCVELRVNYKKAEAVVDELRRYLAKRKTRPKVEVDVQRGILEAALSAHDKEKQ